MTKELEVELKGFAGQIIGPIFLICTVFLAAKFTPIANYDLVAIAIIGLLLCAKWQLRGCLFALTLLSLSACIKHFFLGDHHLLQAGFECSLGLALITTTLIFQQDATVLDGLFAQSKANAQTIQYLEEDLTAQKQLASQEGIATAEKFGSLNLQLEEALTESSSYQMLNDVLRKASAKTVEEKDHVANQLLQAGRKIGQLLSEVDCLQVELGRLSQESSIVQQNSQLFKELNEARIKEAQTHLVNETLVRMHRNESLKARQLETASETSQGLLQKVEGDFAQLASRYRDLESDLQSKELKVRQLETASETNQGLLQKIEGDFAQLASRYRDLEVQSKEPSISAEQEILLLNKIKLLEAERDSARACASETETLQTRIGQFGQVELLYRQLKGNFEEKNLILHQTRVELFKTDTQLQTLQQEIQQKGLEVDPMSGEILAEIEVVEKENRDLLEENIALQDLVTRLMSVDVPVKKK